MSFQTRGRTFSTAQSFNMTPLIDIVFLLIIFFLVVFQFIEAENFPVSVPDKAEFAQSSAESDGAGATVTIMKTAEDKFEFAVGAEKVEPGYAELTEKLTTLIDVRLADLPTDRKVVTLRIDRDVRFAQAQYALAAVAASEATDIQLAVLKTKRNEPQ